MPSLVYYMGGVAKCFFVALKIDLSDSLQIGQS